MKSLLRSLFFLLLWAGLHGSAAAQVQDANCDNCNCPQGTVNFGPAPAGPGFTQHTPPIWNATGIPPCGTDVVATIDAGKYRVITMAANRVYTISLCATSPEVNTILYITANTGTLPIFACDDDGCGTPGGLSVVQVTTQSNLNLAVRIYATLGCGVPTSAPVTVTISCDAVVPPNDLVCNATPLPATSTACNFQLSSNLGASHTNGPLDPTPADCASGTPGYVTNFGGDVWYSVVVPPSGDFGIITNELDICAGSLSLYRITSGACPGTPALTYIGGTCTQEGLSGPGSDPGAIFTGYTAGEVIYVRYWERGGPRYEHGEFQICAFDPERPVNDNPCGAITLPASLNCNALVFSNEYASPLGAGVSADAPGCGNTTYFNDVWFRVQWTAQMASDGLTVNTFAGTLNDMAMALYYFAPGNACPSGHLTVLPTVGPGTACNAEISPTNLMASVNTRNPLTIPSPALAVGDYVYVRVWSETPYFGTFSICAFENELPPNDDPCGAIPLDVNNGCVLVPANMANATYTSPSVYGAGSIIPIVGGCGTINNANPHPDVWFTIQVPTPKPSNNRLTFDTDAGILTDAALAYYGEVPTSTGCAGTLRLGLRGCAAIGSTHGTATMPGAIDIDIIGYTAGETVWIRVWHQDGPIGNFSICASRTDPPAGDCIYTVNLYDSGNDGWQGSEVTVCNNGVCNSYTNLTGSTITLNFGVLSGTPFSVTYNANGAGQQNQNRFNVVQTTFTPNSQVFNSGNGMANGNVYSTTSISCAAPPSPPTDCLGATPMCEPVVGALPNNDSGLPDLNNGNRGCLAGESGGMWYSLNVAQDGNMAFTVDYNGGFALSIFGFIIPLATNNYDFAIWGPYGPYLPVDELGVDTAGLELMCPPNTAPIRCSNRYADWQGDFLSLGFNAASTGLVQDPALPVSGPQRFIRHLAVQTGQVYLLYVTPTQINAGPGAYTISWHNTGPGGAPLDPDPLANYAVGDPLLVCGPLPIELLGFKARAVDSYVDVSWSTATEANSSYFEVQRSADGANFVSVGRVSAAGHSVQRINYGFMDADPLQGTSYYRLRSVDLDGSLTYSETDVVHFGRRGVTGLDLYPNPANASITVGFDLSREGAVQWRVLDALGRSLDLGNVAGDRGRNRFQVPLDRLDAGSYLMELRNGDGSPLGTARFVKE